jgi:hypothetical protein
MINILDLLGNSYPIPSYKVHRIDDIRTQLFETYGLENADLFWKQALVTDETEIDSEMLDGLLPITAIPHAQIAAMAQASGTTCELGVNSFSAQRFFHFSFVPGVLARESSGSDDDEPVETEDDFLGPPAIEEEPEEVVEDEDFAMIFPFPPMLMPFGIGISRMFIGRLQRHFSFDSHLQSWESLGSGNFRRYSVADPWTYFRSTFISNRRWPDIL